MMVAHARRTRVAAALELWVCRTDALDDERAVAVNAQLWLRRRHTEAAMTSWGRYTELMVSSRRVRAANRRLRTLSRVKAALKRWTPLVA